MSPQREIALQLLEQFPNSGSLTLGRIAFNNNPSVFLNAEAARRHFRKLRGATGKYERKCTPQQEHYRELQASGDPFGSIPEGKTHFEDWEAFKVGGPVKALIVSDLHIPYHAAPELRTALEWGRKNGADTVLLNGDTADFFTVSFWEKDPRKRKLAEEIKAVRDFLTSLRQGFPAARIIFKDGNHEERWERYLRVKAPELIGVADFELPAVLQFDRAKIDPDDYVSEKRPVRLGDLNVIHGHEYRFAIANPVNAARGLYLRAKSYALCGHFHQSSQHTEKNLEEKTLATWSTGCLCDLHPDYAPMNNWSHGFAFVEVDKAGKFQVHNHTIKSGKVY